MRTRGTRMAGIAVAAIAALAAAGAAAWAAEQCADTASDAKIENDYPTVTRADYIYACMLVNGQTRDVLEKCSCSIDVIAEVLPYKQYEEAETIMSVRQRGGESVAYLYAPPMLEKVRNMKRAQVEGEIRCF
jgi:hypothetical protein